MGPNQLHCHVFVSDYLKIYRIFSFIKNILIQQRWIELGILSYKFILNMKISQRTNC